MAHLLAESQSIQNHIVSCNYLSSPVGGVTRRWSVDELKPYILYLHHGRIVDNFYGGVLFEPGISRSGRVVGPKTIGFGGDPSITDWRESVNELFRSNENIPALLKVSRYRLWDKPVDVWVTLPYPLQSHDEFGIIGGNSIAFNNPEDRAHAIQWWIDEFVLRWKLSSAMNPGHKTVLRGFCWGKSSILPSDEQVVADTIQHVHSKGLKIFWIRNYGTGKGADGDICGFDFAFIRPTFLGESPRGLEWITYSSMFASAYQEGMVIWGDVRVSEHQILDQLNVGSTLFMQAGQIYELPYLALAEWYRRLDPMYVYLYCYTKNAFRAIQY
jgi:hypothetical protein